MAEKSWQVMHMNVMKGITTAQSNEHQRNWTESGWKHAIDKGTYDRQRERLNFEIVKGGKVRPINKDKSIPERMAENLAGRGIKIPIRIWQNRNFARSWILYWADRSFKCGSLLLETRLLCMVPVTIPPMLCFDESRK